MHRGAQPAAEHEPPATVCTPFCWGERGEEPVFRDAVGGWEGARLVGSPLTREVIWGFKSDVEPHIRNKPYTAFYRRGSLRILLPPNARTSMTQNRCSTQRQRGRPQRTSGDQKCHTLLLTREIFYHCRKVVKCVRDISYTLNLPCEISRGKLHSIYF